MVRRVTQFWSMDKSVLFVNRPKDQLLLAEALHSLGQEDESARDLYERSGAQHILTGLEDRPDTIRFNTDNIPLVLHSLAKIRDQDPGILRARRAVILAGLVATADSAEMKYIARKL